MLFCALEKSRNFSSYSWRYICCFSTFLSAKTTKTSFINLPSYEHAKRSETASANSRLYRLNVAIRLNRDSFDHGL